MGLLSQGKSPVIPSLDAFRDVLLDAEKNKRFGQLILVGSSGDIAWMQMSLPADVAKHVVAEIQYPLMPGWFRQSPPASLQQALENLLSAA